MTQSTNLIAENSTLVLYLDKHGQQFSDTLGKIDYVKPFLHVGSYYCLDNRVALLRTMKLHLIIFPSTINIKWIPVLIPVQKRRIHNEQIMFWLGE